MSAHAVPAHFLKNPGRDATLTFSFAVGASVAVASNAMSLDGAAEHATA
jgi:hypothetical protein